MPRFTFTESGSSKFWEIELVPHDGRLDTRIELTWGRIGTKGTSKVKDFDERYKATREYEKLIAAKLAEGYSPEGEKTIRDHRGGRKCVACDGACEEWVAAPGINNGIKRKTGVLEVQSVYGAGAKIDSVIFCPACSPQADAMIGAMVEAVKIAAADRKLFSKDDK